MTSQPENHCAHRAGEHRDGDPEQEFDRRADCDRSEPVPLGIVHFHDLLRIGVA
jgi:hypothetical protein